VARKKSRPSGTPLPVPVESIERRIYLIRGQKVMLDADLAELYHVATRALNQQVRRNAGRFPSDFMFQLTSNEAANLRSQFVTSSWGGRRTPPYAFTEHGVAMLSSVLNSGRAVQMSILIIRAFVKMRELLASHKNLAARVEKLEASQKRHASVINILAEEIEDLKQPPVEPPKRRIGFHPPGS
jgi:ORF6N domain-containing protein